jgi:hypothetical protein
MRKLLITFPIILLGFSLTFGQDASELAIIRTLLGVSPNTPLVSSRSAALPADKPLKVYVDVSGDSPERDSAVRNMLIQGIDEWSKDENAQHAKLELASDSTDAYVALIHFTDFPFAMDFVAGSASGQMDVNPRTGQSDNVILVSNTLRMTMIVYTYIVIREPKALKILYRRKDPILSRTTVLASTSRTNEATASLRKEIDKEIAKRKAKSQGDKNARSPEYRLRDEFTSWLTSGGSAPGKE